ncbi:DUF393 domain-containing protein [Riemerella anatipestifer]|uniref:DCC1-like thiol-disulfide oxidoreductase family protein n=1 Tax=Riemerella anatipestifer TaxID=34085 RepID=UPI0007ECB342|nr:DCC1-like thiol-disulfide oxidoreductase family protein [Riemerella anatipestifer]AZZ58488.1 DUF393 domain-containing protein [Riemerella anatipestifer]MBO4233001.1 DUF393 domain-containing protein [Riemerella anatipestifer]MCO7318921.1 DUF393 domain-containing protein [Riemerella anatipestifer]MCQ4155206.1 DUF393 domain-containing protein [Riemerella anatipestifer]MCQ4181185.1 DUF393 domain-containing protein [Riemerella anatipestifer]
MKSLVVVYDNWCPKCNRFAKFVKKWDWFDLVKFYKLRNYYNDFFFKDLNKEKSEEQMASYVNEWRYGFESLYLISVRVPLFWLLTPLMLILKLTGIGQKIYLEVAVRRKIHFLHCDKDCRVDNNNN